MLCRLEMFERGGGRVWAREGEYMSDLGAVRGACKAVKPGTYVNVWRLDEDGERFLVRAEEGGRLLFMPPC